MKNKIIIFISISCLILGSLIGTVYAHEAFTVSYNGVYYSLKGSSSSLPQYNQSFSKTIDSGSGNLYLVKSKNTDPTFPNYYTLAVYSSEPSIGSTIQFMYLNSGDNVLFQNEPTVSISYDGIIEIEMYQRRNYNWQGVVTQVLPYVEPEPPILVKIYDVIVNSNTYQSISKLGKWVRDSVTDALTFEPTGSLISVNIGDTITVTNSDNTVTNIPTTYVQPVVTYNGGNTSVNINTNKLVDYMGDNEVTFQSIKYDITYEYIDESENVVNETYTYNYNYNDKEIVYGPQEDPTANNSTDDTTITVTQDPSADKVQNSSGALSSIIDSVVGFFAQAVSGIVSGLGTVASLLGGIVSSLGNIFVDIGNIVNVAFGGTIGTIVLLGFIGTIILIFLKR